jgi:hypothetical protein
MRPFGTLPGRTGVWMLVASGLVGLIATVLAHSDPGDLLGLFVIAGTLAAALGVRTDAVHLIIPIPALVYLGAGLIAGLFHDRAVDTSRTALLVHAVQWVAAGFLAIAASTLLAITITVARRLRARSPAGSRRMSPAASQQWRDVGRRDVGHRNAGRRDAGRWDAGRWDAGHRDAGHRDTGGRDPSRREPGRRPPVAIDREWHYLYDRNPDDRPDAAARPPRRSR